MISKEKNDSLYNQLVEILMNQIKYDLVPGDKLLSERMIAEEYNVSRTTVRLALDELEKQGFIVKEHGRGTFVSDLWKDMTDLSDVYSFTDHMKELNRNPKTKILSFSQISVDKMIANALGIQEGQQAYELTRLRIADDIPMMYEINYLPASLFPELSLELLRKKPLYTVIGDDYNYVIKYADDEFSASLITAEESKILNQKKGDACLRIKRVTYNLDNKVVEYTLSVARSDQFIYKIRHIRA